MVIFLLSILYVIIIHYHHTYIINKIMIQKIIESCSVY